MDTLSIICAQLGKVPHRGQDTKVRVSVARGQLLLASWLDLSPDWLQTLGSCCQSCCCPLNGAHKAGVLTMVKCAGQSEDAAGMQQIADRYPRATTTRHLHTMNCLSSCFVLPQILAHTHTYSYTQIKRHPHGSGSGYGLSFTSAQDGQQCPCHHHRCRVCSLNGCIGLVCPSVQLAVWLAGWHLFYRHFTSIFHKLQFIVV